MLFLDTIFRLFLYCLLRGPDAWFFFFFEQELSQWNWSNARSSFSGNVGLNGIRPPSVVLTSGDQFIRHYKSPSFNQTIPSPIKIQSNQFNQFINRWNLTQPVYELIKAINPPINQSINQTVSTVDEINKWLIQISQTRRSTLPPISIK